MLAQQQGFGLLYLDLTCFKPFNDQYGHGVGDAVLCLVAKRIKMQIRKADLAAQIGGDGFVTLLGGLDDKRRMDECARTVGESLCAPFNVLGVQGSIEVSIRGALDSLLAALIGREPAANRDQPFFLGFPDLDQKIRPELCDLVTWYAGPVA